MSQSSSVWIVFMMMGIINSVDLLIFYSFWGLFFILINITLIFGTGTVD